MRPPFYVPRISFMPPMPLRDRNAISRRRAAWMCLASGLMSSVVVYFMDPERGRRRRNMARDRVMSRARRVGRGMSAIWRGAAAETVGISHRIVHLVPKPSELTDDETLRQRVESQLFRDRHIPKGDLNINAEHGMVILRGQLESPIEIQQLEERVRHMLGVRGVQNLLHPRGTPAPNKHRSWLAGQQQTE